MDPAHPYRLVAVGRHGTAYLSGVLPYRDDGSLASEPAESIDCALATLDRRLADAGLGRGDVVKATVFVTDIGWLAALNERWAQHFAASLPARTTVEVRALPRGAGIEIDAIAETGGPAVSRRLMGGYHAGPLAVMAEQMTARGVAGVVAAASPIAASRGVEVMRCGGNAYDAAVTAALVETVVLPPKCGLGGDLVALHRRAGSGEPEAIVAIGGAPAGLATAIGTSLPETGPLSVGPPAAAAGYASLAALGRLDRAALAAPAGELATGGFVWPSICAWLGERSRELVAVQHPAGCTYYPGGEPLAAGAVVRLPGLGRALDEWVDRGAETLGGPLGDAILACVARAGGVLAEEDFAHAGAEIDAAERTDVGEWTLWATPIPTHGPSLLDTVRRAGGPVSPAELYGVFLDAVAARRAAIGDGGGTGTSMVSAADREGNIVVIVHSNSYPRFGSGLIVDEYDLILNNRAGRGFSADPADPNFPRAGVRPPTTLHAWAARRGGGPLVLGGTPGGANQVSWNAQLLNELLGGVDEPGRLVVSPRWEWRPADDSIVVEEGFDADDAAALDAASRGEPVHIARWGLRCAQQVVAVPSDGPLVAAADPRTVGAAVAV